jgi:hypothetical protein
MMQIDLMISNQSTTKYCILISEVFSDNILQFYSVRHHTMILSAISLKQMQHPSDPHYVEFVRQFYNRIVIYSN